MHLNDKTKDQKSGFYTQSFFFVNYSRTKKVHVSCVTLVSCKYGQVDLEVEIHNDL